MTAVRRLLLIGSFFLFLAFFAGCDNEQKSSAITLWHSYRGTEQQALDAVIAEWNETHPDQPVLALSVPYDAFTNKLTSAIPRGNGPDLFIAAHERIGDWVASGLLEPAPNGYPGWSDTTFLTNTNEAVRYENTTYGFPLAFKSIGLFANSALLNGQRIPQTTDELMQFCDSFKRSNPEKFCLAYEAGSFYHHAGWLYAFGGDVFEAAGKVALDSPENEASMTFVRQLTQNGYLPEEPSGSLVTQLFNDGNAAFVINGPWFLGEINSKINYEIGSLPIVSETGRHVTPFLTVETVLFPVHARHAESAAKFARFLAGQQGSKLRLTLGKQAVAYAALYSDPTINVDKKILTFRSLVDETVPMPNNPAMRSVWEPAAQALRAVLRGAAEPSDALKKAQWQFSVATRPVPQPANPIVYLVIFGLLLAGLGALAYKTAKRLEIASGIRRNFAAYGYIAPAALGMLILVFIPFTVGTVVSLFAHRQGEFTFVGLANFWSILSSRDYGITDPLSFYFTLAVTVMWTAANVFLHVTIGLGLALLLRDPWLKLRGVYRVLLIVPWAVPNYITALIWKGMFHKQFGAINGLLVWVGLEPVSWFSHFWTSFAANVSTNTWLGFPFMMVVTLGALQAIPRDLEEAAEVDGAGRFTRFWYITLPLLRPALLPAVILGSVWTFNMFNIIYLVSGGEPDGATEILITEAYRWAFTRQEQYGYAAAYATLIFMVLLAYSWGTRKLVKET
jgi:arabinogalactan oligomer/maltooligosaccharide transport system permease protein